MAGKLPAEVTRLLDLLYDDEEIESLRPGRGLELGGLYLYAYNAKWKDSLPYWDALPMVVLLDADSKYLQGINIHYIPYTYRINLINDIMRKLEQKKRLTYGDVKGALGKVPAGYMYLAYRKYLLTHIKSNIRVFTPENYLPAVRNVLPDFQKVSYEDVIRDIQRRFKAMKNKKG